MKKFKLGLFPKVLIAITLGALLGLVMPDVGVRIFKTFNVLFAQLLKFIVPLLVLGLVTPAISNLGKGAGKMLLTVIAVSYVSTICSGFFAYGSASWLFPKILEVGSLSTDAAAAKVFEPYINLRIPPLCDILTALCLSRGDAAAEDQAVGELVPADGICVELRVDEDAAARIRPGDKAELYFADQPEVSVPGAVDSVAWIATDGEYAVRVHPLTDAALSLGMSVSVRL